MAALEGLGFRVVDCTMTLEKPRAPTEDTTAPEHGVRMALASDESLVAALAKDSMTNSRFHLDPAIPPQLAGRIKEEWVRNFFRGTRGQWMVVAARDQAVEGFLQLLQGSDGALIVDLIAVAASARGCGLAVAMSRFAERECETSGGAVRVGTQVSNIPALRLYTKLGFQSVSSTFVLHCHGPVSAAE